MKPLSLASLALTLSVGGLAGLTLPVAPAAAQNGVVRCESQNNRERVCNTGWRSAQMVRQLSGSSCVEGRTWGSRNGSIWVTNGCRAEFVEGRGGWGGGNGGNWGGGSGGTIRCESQDNRERTCPTNWRGATLVRVRRIAWRLGRWQWRQLGRRQQQLLRHLQQQQQSHPELRLG